MSEETLQQLMDRLVGVVSFYARRNEHGGNLAMRVVEGLAHEEDQRPGATGNEIDVTKIRAGTMLVFHSTAGPPLASFRVDTVEWVAGGGELRIIGKRVRQTEEES